MSPPPDLAYQYSPEELRSRHPTGHGSDPSASGHSHHSQHSQHSYHSGQSRHASHTLPPDLYLREEAPRGKFERPPDKEVKSAPLIVVRREPDDLPDLHIDELIRAARGETAGSEDALGGLIIDVRHLHADAHAGKRSGKKTGKHGKLPLRQTHPLLHRILSVLLAIAIVIGTLTAGGALWVTYQLHRGRTRMVVNYDDVVIALPAGEQQIETEDSGQTVKYNGHVYALNPNISTVLFMGIDRSDMDGTDVYGNGGQADVIMLLSLDTVTGSMKLLNISRDTFAEYMVYSESGYLLGYDKQQICLAYAYGDGREKSCENTVRAVQSLLYGMPISKYIAMDMDGVVAANDAIGGVTLTSLEDVRLTEGKELKSGEQVTLLGADVNRYLRSRQHDLDGNNRRIERQKQYVSGFFSAAVQQAKNDLSVIPALYDEIMPYIVTDLELSDLMFLAKIYLSCGMDFAFQSLPGDMDWLENQYGKDVAVLYPDEDALFEAVLDLYYTQIE